MAGRYATVARTLPYVARYAVARRFRRGPAARATLARITDPEMGRAVHDLYCGMFLRGYRQSTGRRVDEATGLAAVLFAVFIYALDDEFERRGSTDVDLLLEAPPVAEIWAALGGYLAATGRDDAVRRYIAADFLGAGLEQYGRDIAAVAAGAGFAAAVRVVEYDSGTALRTMYHLIRLFNGHPVDPRCADEFADLGMAGKFLDDLADYSDDVRSGNPNLLHELAAAEPAVREAALAAALSGRTVTEQWWAEHGPAIHDRYLAHVSGYYDRVRSPALRLPLDVYLTLLRTRRFWTISTVRASRRTA